MKLALALICTIVSLKSFATITPKWKKLENKKGVEVYRGEIQDSDIVAFRGVSTIDASIGKVLSVIYDVSRIKEWMSDINDVRVLEKKSKFEKIEYNRTNAPWPISDRDFVYSTKVSVKKEVNAVEIFVESIEHKDAPSVKGVVRGQLHLSRYFVKSLEDGAKTHIEVEILADPKGSLPKWVVNLFQSSWPVNTVNGIRRLATEESMQIHPDVAEAIAQLESPLD